jgi:hypothetical protein
VGNRIQYNIGAQLDVLLTALGLRTFGSVEKNITFRLAIGLRADVV